MTNVQQQPKVSVGGKIVMGFGAILILGGLFMVHTRSLASCVSSLMMMPKATEA